LQTVDCIGGNLAIVGKQTQVRILFLLFIKHRQRLAPGYLLLIVDLAEIENGSLHRFVGRDAMVFYNAEVAVIFTVFFAMDATQKHADDSLPEVRGQKEDTWSSTLPFFQSSAIETHDLTTKIMAKMPKIACNWSSWVRLGTVKKSNAAITSRWLLRKASQRFALPSSRQSFRL